MKRLQFITLCLTMLLAITVDAAQKDQSGFPKVKHMIDTHIHIYDTTRKDGVPWPPKSDTVLYKPHLPDEFKRVSKPTGLTGVVIVEASDRLEDNRWVLDLVRNDGYFVALVGNVDVYREDFNKELKRLAKDKRFVGIRARRKGGVDFTKGLVIKNLRKLAQQGLTLDMLVNGKGLAGIEQVNHVAQQIPELRIVVDHVLGYNIDGLVPDKDWVAAVKILAKHKNVYCKVSGLFQRCVQQPAPKNPAHYRPVLDVLWKNFGSKRLIYGSNWPCTKNSGDYASFVRLVNAYFSKKGQEASERFFWMNAAEAYKLDLKN